MWKVKWRGWYLKETRLRSFHFSPLFSKISFSGWAGEGLSIPFTPFRTACQISGLCVLAVNKAFQRRRRWPASPRVFSPRDSCPFPAAFSAQLCSISPDKCLFWGCDLGRLAPQFRPRPTLPCHHVTWGPGPVLNPLSCLKYFKIHSEITFSFLDFVSFLWGEKWLLRFCLLKKSTKFERRVSINKM